MVNSLGLGTYFGFVRLVSVGMGLVDKKVTRGRTGLECGNTPARRDRTLEDVYTPGTLIFWTHPGRPAPLVGWTCMQAETLSLVVDWVDGTGIRAVCGGMEFEIPRSELNDWAIFIRGEDDTDN